MQELKTQLIIFWFRGCVLNHSLVHQCGRVSSVCLQPLWFKICNVNGTDVYKACLLYTSSSHWNQLSGLCSFMCWLCSIKVKETWFVIEVSWCRRRSPVSWVDPFFNVAMHCHVATITINKHVIIPARPIALLCVFPSSARSDYQLSGWRAQCSPGHASGWRGSTYLPPGSYYCISSVVCVVSQPNVSMFAGTNNGSQMWSGPSSLPGQWCTPLPWMRNGPHLRGMVPSTHSHTWATSQRVPVLDLLLAF